jgi:hypothetical protein
MSQPLNIIIVEKTGTLKSLLVKDFKEEELFKKCGFKKAEDFIEQIEWNVKLSGTKYYVKVFAKTEGRANNENKYDFPPPIDTKLFFGNCAVVAFLKHDKKDKKDKKENNDKKQWVDLTLELWEKIYEKLFGGFEDLSATAAEDEEEEDELANVPKERKTKDGYLKDGFVVDSSETDNNDLDDDSESDSKDDEDDDLDEALLELGSELSEEEYDYSDDSKE